MKSDAINLKADINHTHSGYAPTSHNHSASDITSGTLSTSRLPISSSQVNSTAYIPTSSLVYSMNQTISGFSSSIADHESRIEELEMAAKGLIQVDSYGGWAFLYMPTNSSSTLGMVRINASSSTGYILGGAELTLFTPKTGWGRWHIGVNSQVLKIINNQGYLAAYGSPYSEKIIIDNSISYWPTLYLYQFNGSYTFTVYYS